ncbi:unnamed protein product [Brassica oleracea var. botrytis]
MAGSNCGCGSACKCGDSCSCEKNYNTESTTAAAGQTVAVETTAAVEGKPHACRKTGGIMCLMLRDMCVCLNKDLGFMLPNTSLNV